ncbi:hypothetical protein [Candidatus Viridilinea mediisalina]|uniref:Uncharacterized protein n=1 Tax=Candidatus Viridilinea mediisalina TaxID=2024553 RepID=A0A2A6RKP8_9CHLR|nr:hypothetical protein [Candidatus Viridilinea mediisalina]PDW03430.1 hypothetical protein CJ255_08860 [Candidatus Viridilinea mediisalina]
MAATSSVSLEGLATYQRAGDAAAGRITAAGYGLDAALGPFHARCVEYPVHATRNLTGRIFGYANHEGTLVRHVAELAQAFRQADSGWLGAMLPGFMRAWHYRDHYGRDAPTALVGALNRDLALRLQHVPTFGAVRLYDAWRTASWNGAGRSLNLIARITNRSIALSESRWPQVLPLVSAVFAGPMIMAGLSAAGLSVVGDAPRWLNQPVNAPSDLLHLSLQGFWYEGMAHLNPQLFQSLSAQVDQLSLATCAELERCTPSGREPEVAERIVDPLTGALDVAAEQVFLHSFQAGQRFQPQAADAMHGDHSAISYAPGEQVRLERLNAERGDYRISIAGLNPNQPGAINNFEAVAMTAQGISEGNHYYEEVRARFLADLERIPPGSVLHLQGHSMGGGMCFLLRDDPLVQASLVAAGVVIGSMITFGAVRPQGPAGQDLPREAGNPFAHAEERHYVDTDDSLARNVGAGHVGFANVFLLENNQVNDPVFAHGDYENPENYHALPPDLQRLPFEVDPESYEVYAPTSFAAIQLDEEEEAQP